jgi:hypothetical protein
MRMGLMRLGEWENGRLGEWVMRRIGDEENGRMRG